jgi:hypothetical protein
MSAFNRNIITNADIERLLNASNPSEVPKTLAAAPPAGAIPAATTANPSTGGSTAATSAPAEASGGSVVPSGDDYSTKLVKYVPPELVGAYVFLSATISTNAAAKDRPWWLGGLLIAMLALTALYDWRVLNIVRAGQIVISVIGLGVYVFAVGGWFATTTWYQPWYGSIALVVFGLLVAVVRLRPLPTQGETVQQKGETG